MTDLCIESVFTESLFRYDAVTISPIQSSNVGTVQSSSFAAVTFYAVHVPADHTTHTCKGT